jgi:diguanylate cyclase (GGDEF)-like protein
VDLREASLSDPLTGLRNRRFVMQEMPGEIERLLRRRESLRDSAGMVLYLIDIDGFKSVNDRFGHAAGDALIRQFAARLRHVFRDSDDVVRWGGEEFLVVARDISMGDAARLAARVRDSVAAEPFVLDDGTEVARTCCVGFAPFPFESARPRAHDWEAVAEVADRALLAAKRLGRDAWIGLHPAVGVPLDGAVSDWLLPARIRACEIVVLAAPAVDPARVAAVITGTTASDGGPGFQGGPGGLV